MSKENSKKVSLSKCINIEEIKEIPENQNVDVTIYNDFLLNYTDPLVCEILEKKKVTSLKINAFRDLKKEDVFKLLSIPSIKRLYFIGKLNETFSTKFKESLKQIKKLKYLNVNIEGFNYLNFKIFFPKLRYLKEIELNNVNLDEDISSLLSEPKLKKVIFQNCKCAHSIFEINFKNLNHLKLVCVKELNMKSLYYSMKGNKMLKKLEFKKIEYVEEDYLFKILNDIPIYEFIFHNSILNFNNSKNFSSFIKKLEFKTIKIDDFDNFVKFINDQSYMEILILKRFNFGNEKMEKLMKNLINHKSLNTLSLNNVEIDNIQIFEKYLRESTLEKLRISDFIKNGFEEFSRGLKYNHSLKKLYLFSLETHSITKLPIITHGIQSLVIGNLDLISLDLSLFFESLLQNKELRKLHIHTDLNISDSIFNYLNSNPLLAVLKITCENDFNVSKVVKSLYNNTNLKYFMFYGEFKFNMEILELFLYNYSLFGLFIDLDISDEYQEILTKYEKRNMEQSKIYSIPKKGTNIHFCFE